jgi:VanZ family protein
MRTDGLSLVAGAHETFVRGRHGSPIDVGIDAVGALIGLSLLRRRSG